MCTLWLRAVYYYFIIVLPDTMKITPNLISNNCVWFNLIHVRLFAISYSPDTARKTNWIIFKLYFTKSFPPRLAGWLLYTAFASFVWFNMAPTTTCTAIIECVPVLMSVLVHLLRCISAIHSRHADLPTMLHNRNTSHKKYHIFTHSSSSENFCNSIKYELTATVRQRLRWKNNARRKVMHKTQTRRSK